MVDQAYITMEYSCQWTLSTLEIRCFHLWLQGYSYEDIAASLSLVKHSVCYVVMKSCCKLYNQSQHLNQIETRLA